MKISYSNQYTLHFVGISLLTILFAFLFAFQPAQAQQSLYADIKAFGIGDAITIVLAERTAAQRESGWERKTNSGMGGSASLDGASLNGSFGMNATFNNESSNQNESVQRDLLQGTMTAVVVALDSLSGNLVIEGKRNLNVNGDTHIMKVRGMVRPFDIMSDNSVMSYKLANADIEYRRAGDIKSALKRPGALAGAAAILLVGAAVMLGSD